MDNSKEWEKIYAETNFGNKYASSYLVSFFYNRIKPILLKKPVEKINVLDIACSLGANSKIFAECGMNVFGIDISDDAVAKARKNVPTARFENYNLLENVCLKDVFGVTFDLIIASACMCLFTDKERCIINHKFLEGLETGGLIYINTPTYETEAYNMYKGIEKDKNGMVKVNSIGSVHNTMQVNLPSSIEEFKTMFKEFHILDIVTTDTPIYSGRHQVHFHLLGQKC